MAYDIELNEIYRIPIFTTDSLNTFTTRGIVGIDEKVMIFPKEIGQGIYLLDIKDMKVQRSVEFDGVFKDINSIDTVLGISESKIAILERNSILEIDIKRKLVTYRKEFADDKRIFTIKFDGVSYWLLFQNSTDVCEWNPKTDKIAIYKLKDTEQEWIGHSRIPYNNIIFLQGRIILLGYGLKYIMQVDTVGGLIYKAIDYPKGFKFMHNIFYVNGWGAFSGFDVRGSKIWIHPVIGNMILIYDVENNVIEGKELTITLHEYPLLRDYWARGRRFYEGEFRNSLETFILNEDDYSKDNYSENRTSHKRGKGKEIYNVLKYFLE